MPGNCGMYIHVLMYGWKPGMRRVHHLKEVSFFSVWAPLIVVDDFVIHVSGQPSSKDVRRWHNLTDWKLTSFVTDNRSYPPPVSRYPFSFIEINEKRVPGCFLVRWWYLIHSKRDEVSGQLGGRYRKEEETSGQITQNSWGAGLYAEDFVENKQRKRKF